MSPFEVITIVIMALIYFSLLGGLLAYGMAKADQCDYLAMSNRQLHHDLKLERITKDNEHYIRHRDRASTQSS